MGEPSVLGGSPCLACGGGTHFFTSEEPKSCHAWSCQSVCEAVTFLLGGIFVLFGTGLCSLGFLWALIILLPWLFRFGSGWTI